MHQVPWEEIPDFCDTWDAALERHYAYGGDYREMKVAFTEKYGLSSLDGDGPLFGSAEEALAFKLKWL